MLKRTLEERRSPRRDRGRPLQSDRHRQDEAPLPKNGDRRGQIIRTDKTGKGLISGTSALSNTAGDGKGTGKELELELVQAHMAQKPVLRVEVGARALHVRSVSREEARASAGVQDAWVSGCGCEAD